LNPLLRDDLARVGRPILEVTRAVIAAETGGGTYPAPAAPVAHLDPDAPLATLAMRAGLLTRELLILRILVAGELDRHVHRALLRLSSDATRPAIPVDGVATAIELLGGDAAAVPHDLRPDGALVARGLVTWCSPPGPTLTRRGGVHPRVLAYACGTRPEPVVDPPGIAAEVPLPADRLCPVAVRDQPDDAEAVPHLRRILPGVVRGDLIWLSGPPGSGRRTLLASVAAELGKAVLAIDYRDAKKVPRGELAPLLWREALLADGLICVHDADLDDGDAHDLAALYMTLARAGVPMVWISAQPPATDGFDWPPHVIRLGDATPAARLALWRRSVPGLDRLEELSTRFRLPPARLVRAARLASQVAHARGAEVSAEDVGRAVSLQVAQQVSTVGNLVEDSQRWDDVVLPQETLDSVREIVARVKHRHHVLDDWGFRDKLSKGLGLAALFAGPPGTGKTMVASLIARDLGQELYQVDLSRIVSKWVGETEKNLARVFDAADGANVLLLFDEADALFSKRTEVKSSQDRHSNAEVNYLLQRVERFEGVSILTTNLEGSIDPAFKRRLAFRVTFPMPEVAERALLWRRMLPDSVRIDEAVDHGALAADYELSGGNIRNAVLRAAFLAAGAGHGLTMDLIRRAVRLEYRDAGKLGTGGRIHGT